MKKEIKVVIPARYGSTRLPGKPLLKLNHKPIYWHVVQRVLEAGIPLENIVVATDDIRIAQSAESLSIPVQLTDKKHISGTDRINEVASLLGWSDDVIVLNVQGDEPLIPHKLISELTQFTLKNPDFSITTVVSPIMAELDFIDPNIVKAVLGENNRALYFTRSPCPFNRNDPKSFIKSYRHVGIYAYKVSTLKQFCSYPESTLEGLEKLEQLRALCYGMSIGAMIIKDTPPHGVDTKNDYDKLARLMGGIK